MDPIENMENNQDSQKKPNIDETVNSVKAETSDPLPTDNTPCLTHAPSLTGADAEQTAAPHQDSNRLQDGTACGNQNQPQNTNPYQNQNQNQNANPYQNQNQNQNANPYQNQNQNQNANPYQNQNQNQNANPYQNQNQPQNTNPYQNQNQLRNGGSYQHPNTQRGACQNGMMWRPANSLVTASMVMASLSIITALFCTVYLPLLFTGLSIIFALLSKGSEKSFHSTAKTALWIAGIAIVLDIAIVGGSFYMVMTNPDYQKQFNSIYEDFYGKSFDESIKDAFGDL